MRIHDQQSTNEIIELSHKVRTAKILLSVAAARNENMLSDQIMLYKSDCTSLFEFLMLELDDYIPFEYGNINDDIKLVQKFFDEANDHIKNKWGLI